MFPSSTFALVAMAALIFSIGVDSCGRRGSARCGSIVSNVEITFYGAPDNDPPGDETAWSCDDSRGTHAAGTGAYDDPLSFASAEGEYEQCEIVYLPYLRKYLRFDDYCQQCTDDWTVGKKHIDIWTGSGPSIDGGDAQVSCENQLTPDPQIVIRNPATDLLVNTGDLWDGESCHTERAWNHAQVPRC